MELNFRLNFKTKIFHRKKVSELDELIERDSLWIVDRNVMDKFPLSEKNTFLFSGEQSKNFDHLETCLEWLIDQKADRRTVLVAAGGGATTDFGSFIGSIYHRGLRVTLVPTTLLSTVDSSIGGKTAVNFVAKNDIGSFYPAEKVIIVKELFSSLTEEDIAGGKAEIIKVMLLTGNAGFLSDETDLFSEESLDQAIYDKYSVIGDDLDDTLGKRAVLNWGHTFGHAVEKYYGISHGMAVAVGMVLIQKYVEFLGNNCFSFKDLMTLFNKHGIKINIESYLKESSWKKFIRFDKKRYMDQVSLVYLESNGCPRIVKRSLNDILKDLEEMR